MSSISPIVWVVPSMVRVRQDASPMGLPSKIHLYGGRGETVSFQVVVRATRQGLSNVNLYVHDLEGYSRIPNANITRYREHYVSVPVNSDTEGSTTVVPDVWGLFPDALIPFIDPATKLPPTGGDLVAVPCDVSGEKNQPFWVDITIPHDAKAGEYSADFVVSSTQGNVMGEVVLTVWDFELPKKPSTRTLFQYWPWINKFAEEELLRHKVMPMICETPSEERYQTDYLGLNCTDLNIWGNLNMEAKTMNDPPSAEWVAEEVAKHQPDLFLYNYTADEIEGVDPTLYPTLKAWARALHGAGVKNLITMPPIADLMDDEGGQGKSVVDIWVIMPNQFNETLVRQAQAKGDEVWSYTCMVQDTYSPKWQLDYPPINYRILPGFMNQAMGLTGFLYWSVNAWVDDPNGDPWEQHQWLHYEKYYNYDGVLTYPGAKAGLQGVAPSMRLKWIRDGIQDYEYIHQLRAQGYGLQAEAIVAKMVRSFSDWEQSPELLENTRKELGELLNYVMSVYKD